MLGFIDRRAAQRSRPASFATAFGEVVDVSATGMAIVHRGRPVQIGTDLRLSIRWAGEVAQVPCRVRRVEPVGFRRQRIALEWISAPAGLEAWLSQGHGGGAECAGPQVYEVSASA